jgi:hypothetical protein
MMGEERERERERGEWRRKLSPAQYRPFYSRGRKEVKERREDRK